MVLTHISVTLPKQFPICGVYEKNSVLLFLTLKKTLSFYKPHHPLTQAEKVKTRSKTETNRRLGLRHLPKNQWPAWSWIRRRLSGSDNSPSLSVTDRRHRLVLRLAESPFRSALRLTTRNSSKPPWVLLSYLSDFAFAFGFWIGLCLFWIYCCC